MDLPDEGAARRHGYVLDSFVVAAEMGSSDDEAPIRPNRQRDEPVVVSAPRLIRGIVNRKVEGGVKMYKVREQLHGAVPTGHSTSTKLSEQCVCAAGQVQEGWRGGWLGDGGQS